MKLKQEHSLYSRHNEKKITFDVRYIRDGKKKPVVIFIHGFKGFKDWGTFNMIADLFVSQGFIYLKLNLSHNGTTEDSLTEFDDLEAFSENNHSIELDDIDVIIDHLFTDSCVISPIEMNNEKLFLTGHSRGGGLAIIKAFENSRVRALATWAAINDFTPVSSEEEDKRWKQDRVRYIFNGRTKQNMPQKYQLVKDFDDNKKRLDIQNAAKGIRQPWIIFHGTQDETLPLSMAKNLKKINDNARLEIIEGANHTFGGKHPHNETQLPAHTQMIVEKTISFFKEID